MSTWLAGALLIVALFGAGAVTGNWWAGNRAAERIAAAQADKAVCEDQLRSKANAMDQVRGQLADLADRHARALAAATAALDQRDAELEQLHAAAARRAASIRGLTDVDPNVAALARQPVPPRLARELWPAAAARAGADAH